MVNRFVIIRIHEYPDPLHGDREEDTKGAPTYGKEDKGKRDGGGGEC